MKLSKEMNGSRKILFLTVSLAIFGSLISPAQAFFGIAGCPAKKPSVTGAFGTPTGAFTPKVADGVYYSHFLDSQYWIGFLQSMFVPNLPDPLKPTAGRRFIDCNEIYVANQDYGVIFARTDKWKGTAYGPLPYNYTCDGNVCTDPNMMSNIEVVYFRDSDKLTVLHGCIELTDMVQGMVENASPIIMAMVKQFLALDLPDFVMQIVIDAVMKALMNNLRIAHLQWMEVLAPTKSLTAE